MRQSVATVRFHPTTWTARVNEADSIEIYFCFGECESEMENLAARGRAIEKNAIDFAVTQKTAKPRNAAMRTEIVRPVSKNDVALHHHVTTSLDHLQLAPIPSNGATGRAHERHKNHQSSDAELVPTAIPIHRRIIAGSSRANDISVAVAPPPAKGNLNAIRRAAIRPHPACRDGANDGVLTAATSAVASPSALCGWRRRSRRQMLPNRIHCVLAERANIVPVAPDSSPSDYMSEVILIRKNCFER